jgi:hypothetical protein
MDLGASEASWRSTVACGVSCICICFRSSLFQVPPTAGGGGGQIVS